jgi:hypothetical protein
VDQDGFHYKDVQYTFVFTSTASVMDNRVTYGQFSRISAGRGPAHVHVCVIKQRGIKSCCLVTCPF